MNGPLKRYVIPLHSLRDELWLTGSVRGAVDVVKKQANKTFGYDIDTVKKEIVADSGKLLAKKKKLQHLLDQETRTSKVAYAGHALKHLVKSAMGTKKSDSKEVSDVIDDHMTRKKEDAVAASRHAAEDVKRDAKTQAVTKQKAGLAHETPEKKTLLSRLKGTVRAKDKTVPEKYDPVSRTPESKVEIARKRQERKDVKRDTKAQAVAKQKAGPPKPKTALFKKPKATPGKAATQQKAGPPKPKSALFKMPKAPGKAVTKQKSGPPKLKGA